MTALLMSPRSRTPRRPTHYRWTIDQYRHLGRLGWFQDVRTFLIRGEILVTALPDPPHNLALGLVEDWLRIAFANGYHVRNQMAFDVGTENDPGPDLAVVVGSRRDCADRQATQAVLIVEIADLSLDLDTTTKAELYATAGVPEYWVIDVEHRQLQIFRDPVELPKGLGATAYRTRVTLNEDETASPLAMPSASVTVRELLP